MCRGRRRRLPVDRQGCLWRVSPDELVISYDEDRPDSAGHNASKRYAHAHRGLQDLTRHHQRVIRPFTLADSDFRRLSSSEVFVGWDAALMEKLYGLSRVCLPGSQVGGFPLDQLCAR
jgi:hypothetical protein